MAFHDAQDGIWSDSACDRLSWAAPIPADLRAELEGNDGLVPDALGATGTSAGDPSARRFSVPETPSSRPPAWSSTAPGLRSPAPTPRRGLLERNCRSGTLPAPVAVDDGASELAADSGKVVAGLPEGLTPALEHAPEGGLTGSTIPDRLFFGGGGLMGFDPLESPAGSALSHISEGTLQSPSFAAMDDQAATRPVSTSPPGALHLDAHDLASDSEGSANGERAGSIAGIAFSQASRSRGGSRPGSLPGLSPPQGPSAPTASPPRLPPTSAPAPPAELRGGAPPRMVFDARLGCWTIPAFTLAAPSSPALDARTPNPCKLFVGGLGLDTTDANLFAHFSHFGHVASAVVMRNKLTGAPRGFGFVVFTSDRAAAVCLNTRQAICGRPVDISPAVPKAPSPAGLARCSPLGASASGSFTPPHSGPGWASDFAPTAATTASPAQGPPRHAGLPEWSPSNANPAPRQSLHHHLGSLPLGGPHGGPHAGPHAGRRAGPHAGAVGHPHRALHYGPLPGAGPAFPLPMQHQHHGHSRGLPSLPPTPSTFRLPARADCAPTGPAHPKAPAAAPTPSRFLDPTGSIRRIFVGGLPQTATEDDIGRTFSCYGEVVGCELMRDRANGRSRGFGFVTFANPAAAAAAVRPRRSVVLGQQVDVSFAHPREVGRSRLELMSPAQAVLTAAAAERAGQPHALSSLVDRRADASH